MVQKLPTAKSGRAASRLADDDVAALAPAGAPSMPSAPSHNDCASTMADNMMAGDACICECCGRKPSQDLLQLTLTVNF